jgi:hypothetical protein
VLLIWKEFEFLALIAPQPKCGKEIISLVLHSLLGRNPSSIRFSKYGRRCTQLKKNKNMHVSLVMEGMGAARSTPSFFPSFISLTSFLLFLFLFIVFSFGLLQNNNSLINTNLSSTLIIKQYSTIKYKMQELE